MKKNLRILSALGLSGVGLLATCGAAMAADDAAVSTAPSLTSVLESSGITATGYVAASAYHLSTDGGPASFHNYDVDHSTFSLDQAALTVAFQPKEGFGAVVNFIAGQDAQLQNNYEGTSGSFNLTQAYLQYATGGLTVIAGKYVTLAGAEVIAPTGNTNFSRSLLFTNLEPATHTGIRATYAANDVVSFALGVNNGWNVSFDSSAQNSQKTLEASVAVTPMSALSIALTGYFGNESPTNSTRGASQLLDLVTTWKATDALTFVLNVDTKSVKDFSTSGTARSTGVAIYGNWAMTEAWRLSVRVEQLRDDSSGMVTGVIDEKIKEATVTVGYAPTKSSEVRFEVRKDKGDDKIFRGFNSSSAFPDTDSQTEFAIQGLYKF